MKKRNDYFEVLESAKSSLKESKDILSTRENVDKGVSLMNKKIEKMQTKVDEKIEVLSKRSMYERDTTDVLKIYESAKNLEIDVKSDSLLIYNQPITIKTNTHIFTLGRENDSAFRLTAVKDSFSIECRVKGVGEQDMIEVLKEVSKFENNSLKFDPIDVSRVIERTEFIFDKQNIDSMEGEVKIETDLENSVERLSSDYERNDNDYTERIDNYDDSKKLEKEVI